jgi:hypothetical protein
VAFSSLEAVLVVLAPAQPVAAAAAAEPSQEQGIRARE